MAYVQAGILSKLLDSVKQISESFSKFLSKFDDFGLEITKQETLKDGSLKMWCKYGKKNFGMILSPVENSDNLNLKIHVDGKDTEFKNIDEFDIEKKAKETIGKLLNVNFSKGVKSSKELKVTLHKVMSAKTCSIQCTAITANYDVCKADAAFNALLDDTSFTDIIEEKPTSFCITEDDEGYDVDFIVDVDPFEGIRSSIADAFTLWSNCVYLYTALSGDVSGNISSIIQACQWKALNNFNEFVKIYTIGPNTTISPIEILNDVLSIDCGGSVTPDVAASLLKEQIEEYLHHLEFCFPNFPLSAQGLISESIGYWTDCLSQLNHMTAN